jgi:peroxiredoxin-like protein
MITATQTQPIVKYKKFTYQTSAEWIRNRTGVLRSDGKSAFRVASPPEFQGEAGIWTPEDLFVASVQVCLMMTFAAYAEKLKLPLLSYNCTAEGLLESVDGKYQFTKITLFPKILVTQLDQAEAVTKALERAHSNCLVANSIRTEVVIRPEIVTLLDH